MINEAPDPGADNGVNQQDVTADLPRKAASDRTPAISIPEPPVPDRIGTYSVRGVIASGGMGTVYRAVQEQPHRTVALKVIRHGIASRSALRRFEFESQTLARLRHPNIAQVYEAGSHDDGEGGVPFFAMEFVPDARSLTEYASVHSLSIRDRLVMFAKVCDAVQHGHQKGIIHRDLKPSNILVDHAGEPKIIDFGVARATDSDVAVTTLQTDVGQLVGTLQYMSPEQCDAEPDGIDTRSDVYALGVVLYQLLCGNLPYDITNIAIHEAVRVIRDDLPTLPSMIDRTLRGDLETITMKAMEKDRDRRYRSAEALADDLRRYLADEPILARPPSLAYQFARFTRRHKPVVIGAALVLLVLVGGIAATNIALVRALDAESLANDRLVAVDEARERETRARIEADGARRVSERINSFFIEDLLGGLDPRRASSDSIDDLLDRAAARVAPLSDEPLVESSVRLTLGRAYLGLRRFDEAEAQFDRALEIRRELFPEDSIEVTAVKAPMALLIAETGGQSEFPVARELMVDVRAARLAHLGPDDPLTLEATGDLAMLDALSKGNPAADLDSPILDVVVAARALGETREEFLAEVVALQTNTERLWASGEEEAAIELFYELAKPTWDHPLGKRVPWVLYGYARLADQKGYPNCAEATAAAACRMAEDLELPAHHFQAHMTLGTLFRKHQKLERAAMTLRDAAGIASDVYGATSLETILSWRICADCMHELGRVSDAEKCASGALEVLAANEVSDREAQSEAAWLHVRHATFLADLDRPQEAITALQAAWSIHEALDSVTSDDARVAAERLADLHQQLGNDADAEDWRQQAGTE